MLKMKSFLTRGLSIVLILFATVLGFIASVGLWIYLYPNDAWKFAQNHLLPKDIKVEWQQARISIDHVRHLNWDLQISFNDLIITKKNAPQISAKIDHMQLLANVTLIWPKTNFYIQDFTLISDSPLRLQTKPSDKSADQPLDLRAILDKITSSVTLVKSYQQKIVIDKVNVQLKDLGYSSGDSKPILASVLISKTAANSSKIEFALKAHDLSESLKTTSFKGSTELAHFNTSTPFLTADIAIKGPDLNAKTPMALVFDDDQLHGFFELDAYYKLKKGKLATKSTLKLVADQKGISVSTLGSISGIPGPLQKLENVKLNYTLPFGTDGDWLSFKSQAQLETDIPLFFINDQSRKQIEVSCKCKLPYSVSAKLDADIWLGKLLSPSESLSESPAPAVSANFRLQDISNAILSTKLAASLEVFRTTQKWLFKPALDLQVHVERFQDIKEILRTNRILIPAPISVLEGQVDLTAKSPVAIDETTGQYSAKANLSTDLNSLRQQVNVDATLTAGLSADFKTLDINVDARLHDIQLELPPLEPVKGLPRLTRDSRIQLKPVKVKKASDFKILLSFKVQTTKQAAIRLLYPLAHPFIPISVNYQQSGNNKKGSVTIEKFKVSYLRREVFVESLNINLTETPDFDFPIDGLFHVNQTNYKVMIRVAGTIKKPYIELSSDPYLDRADIVSVLLFDRTRENLVGGDVETSGNAAAAMADRAVGLLGLWVFASTPIRSVSYNSITKEYTATVDLGGGVTAGVGTSLDEYTSLEIRKRLSKRWVIATSWVTSEADENNSEVVLQWEKRY